MNKKSFILLSALAVLGLTACEKGIDDLGEGMSPSPTGQVTNSVLQVRTRGTSPSEEATVAYPVQVYVMQGDMCCAAQTIGDEGQTLNIGLVEGTYSVYAIAGASATDYDVPTADDATSTSAITLKEGKAHGDLMAAQATATLIDGGTNTVTLGLQRKTMLLQDITIKKVPMSATAVSVTIAPLWQALTVCGGYSGASGSHTIALTKQSDGRTWKLPSPFGEGTGVRLLKAGGASTGIIYPFFWRRWVSIFEQKIMGEVAETGTQPLSAPQEPMNEAGASPPATMLENMERGVPMRSTPRTSSSGRPST
jgi:hypothetical protein